MNDSITKTCLEILGSEENKIKEGFRTKIGLVNQHNSLVLEDKLKDLKIEAIEKYSNVFKELDYEVAERKEMIEKLSDVMEADCKATKLRIIEAF